MNSLFDLIEKLLEHLPDDNPDKLAMIELLAKLENPNTVASILGAGIGAMKRRIPRPTLRDMQGIANCWRDEGDLRRFTGYKELKPVLRVHHPELVDVLTRYYLTRAKASSVITELVHEYEENEKIEDLFEGIDWGGRGA